MNKMSETEINNNVDQLAIKLAEIKSKGKIIPGHQITILNTLIVKLENTKQLEKQSKEHDTDLLLNLFERDLDTMISHVVDNMSTLSSVMLYDRIDRIARYLGAKEKIISDSQISKIKSLAEKLLQAPQFTEENREYNKKLLLDAIGNRGKTK